MQRKHEKFVILAVALGVILNPLNTTMITVALPAIQKDFQLTATDISWLIASYFIISAIFTPMLEKIERYVWPKAYLSDGIVARCRLVPAGPSVAELSDAPRHAWHPGDWHVRAFSGRHRDHPQHHHPKTKPRHRHFVRLCHHLGGIRPDYQRPAHSHWRLAQHFLRQFAGPCRGNRFERQIYPEGQEKPGEKKHLDYVGILLFSALITTWMLFLLGFGKRHPNGNIAPRPCFVCRVLSV